MKKTLILTTLFILGSTVYATIDSNKKPYVRKKPIVGYIDRPGQPKHVVLEEVKPQSYPVVGKIEGRSFPAFDDLSDEDLSEIDTTDLRPAPMIIFDARPVEVLIDEVKRIIASKGDYDKAIDNLSSIILMQKSDKAREAHELLGIVYEKIRQFKSARREYEKYMVLYPEENGDRNRVRQRLLSIEISEAKEDTVNVAKDRKPKQGDNSELNGSVSEYLLAGSGEGTSLTNINLNSKLEHNEHALVSRIRLTEIKDIKGGNKINMPMAYVEYDNSFRNFSLRLGRQYSTAGAVSRFDGLSYHQELDGSWSINLAAGTPFAGMHTQTNRWFFGTSVEWRPSVEWVIDGYINRQVADGFVERLAIGTNVSYVHDGDNCVLRTEYDTVYHSVNMFTLQCMKYYKDFSLFGLYDRRRSPMPYADIALNLGTLNPNRQAYNSVGDLLSRSGLTQSEIYNYISSSSSIASAFVLGGNYNMAKDLTLSGDLQITNMSTIPAMNVSPLFDPVSIQIGQSNSYAFDFHLKRDNFFWSNNTAEIITTKTLGAMDAYSITIADDYRFGNNRQNDIAFILRVDGVKYMMINNQVLTAILRGVYRINNHSGVEAQFTNSSRRNGDSDHSIYVGYRYDF